MSAPRAGQRVRLAGGVFALLLLSGCGGDDPSPADEVPRLGAVLAQVDDALVDRDYEVARRHLETLVRVTTRSRDDGTLTQEDADRILAASAQLLAAMPGPETVDPEDSLESTVPEPEGGEDEDDQKKLEKERKKLEEERKKLEEERKKQEEERKKLEESEDEGDG